jgi:hypothetical protein
MIFLFMMTWYDKTNQGTKVERILLRQQNNELKASFRAKRSRGNLHKKGDYLNRQQTSTACAMHFVRGIEWMQPLGLAHANEGKVCHYQCNL